jgi:hypothetical protein
MQVLRSGREDLGARQHNARAALVTMAGAGVAGTAALAVGLHPWAGALLAGTIVSVVTKAHRRLRRLTRGIKGAELVAERLRSLSDDYFLLNDVILPGHPGTIDHVVIGPCGVVVIESRGSVESNAGAITVKEALGQVHPDLEDSVLRFVDSIAVFVNPSRRIKVDRAKTIVARYSQLLDVILTIARRKRVPSAVAARLARSLLDLTSQRLTSAR